LTSGACAAEPTAAQPDENVAAAWWALRPVEPPKVPQVKNADRVRNPIDTFILARLEAKGLGPAPEADRATLIRRLTFDLHGLPPTPEEVDAFVHDKADDAYSKVVDRLLASPRYGERWGRHWLDVVHYGDTHGYDRDKRRPHAWRYRDYVIKSLNDDKPYSRFVREQLAGDVLFPKDPDALVATGFIAAGPWDFEAHNELREGTVDKLKTRLIDRDDMLANTMTTFASMTVHCARCHDHKFDPIPQADYFRLQAVFAGVERRNRVVADPNAETRAGLEKKRAALAATLPAGWHSAIAPEADTTKWVQIDLGKAVPIDAIRLHPARPVDADADGYGFPLRFTVAVSNDPTFATSETVADKTLVDFENPGTKPVVIVGKGQTARHVRVTASLLWKRANDAYLFALSEVEVESNKENVAAGAPVSARDSLDAGAWRAKFLTDGFNGRTWLRAPTDKRFQETCAKAVAEYGALSTELDALPAPDLVYAVESIVPRPIHLLKRGDVQKPGELVPPGAASCVTQVAVEFPADARDEGARRVALADWLVHPKNPLTRRTIVNRVWQYHFGRGIVETPSDFGKNGSAPSHPELLDYLADRFRADGESLKKLHKLIVTSNTYRQSSAVNEKAAKVDADNRLLWRMSRTRLEAEAVRDAVLATSGALDLKMGGPGFELFRYKDDKSPVYDHTDVTRINDPANWRRTVYRFTVRSVSNPFLECLDCADPSINTPVRNTTITAQQSLALLNDPFLLKQSELFAERLKKVSDRPAAQVEAGFRIAFGRKPTPAETDLLVPLIEKRGLAQFCRVLFNANEFIFID
jgi:nitrogen fixation protein FixH